MAKRKLSNKQSRRIRSRQSERVSKAAEQESKIEPSKLGVEQEGLITAHYGTFVAVEAGQIESNPGNKTYRCHFRTNLGSLVTGDKVIWQEGDPYGVVVAVLPRTTELTRPDPYTQIKVVAANVDQLAIVIATLPKPHTQIIDRYIVAAETMGVKPLIVINKGDLLEADNNDTLNYIESHYPKLGYSVLRCSAHQASGLSKLEEHLKQLTSIFVGQSGVGKSSLINTLIPDLALQVGEISDYNLKGKHTTTHSQLFHLPKGGHIIDSPGIREFGLWHLDKGTILEGFIELQPYLGRCKFRDCQHQQEPGCAINTALNEGKLSDYRKESLKALLREAEEQAGS